MRVNGIKIMMVLGLGAILFSWIMPARADIKQVKAYKEAFADAKPKCVDCHVDALPKKDGAHELNAYGKAAVEVAATPTADSYKKVGSIEDFNKKAK